MAKAPTFKSLKAAAEAGYHGKSVNIEGKGLQKVAFADKEYDKKMAARSAKAGKKSVEVPPPRPASVLFSRGAPIAEMKPSSTSTQRSMAMRVRNKITQTTLKDKPKGSEGFESRMQEAIDRAKANRKSSGRGSVQATPPREKMTYEKWLSMTPAEREAAGYPRSINPKTMSEIARLEGAPGKIRKGTF